MTNSNFFIQVLQMVDIEFGTLEYFVGYRAGLAKLGFVLRRYRIRSIAIVVGCLIAISLSNAGVAHAQGASCSNSGGDPLYATATTCGVYSSAYAYDTAVGYHAGTASASSGSN